MSGEDKLWYGFWLVIVLFFIAVGFGIARDWRIKDECEAKGGIPIQSRNMQVTCFKKEYIIK